MLNCKTLLLLLLNTFYLNNCLSQSDIAPEVSETDSLSQLLIELNGKNKFPILLELAEQVRDDNPDLAATYMEQAKKWIDEKEINKDLFQYYKTLAHVKLSQHEYPECLSLAEQARQLNVQDIDPTDYIAIYQCIGKVNYMLKENGEAQQAHFKALRIADSLHLDKKVSQITNAIGAVYGSMKDFKMAEKYYLLAIESAKRIEYAKVVNQATGNLALNYIRIEKYDEAEKLILECIEIAKSDGNRAALGVNFNNLAIIYQAREKFEESIRYVKKALVIAEELNSRYSIANRNCNLGELYIKVNNYTLAERHFNIGIEMAKDLGNNDVLEYALNAAVELFEKTGEDKKALDYFRQYSTLKDSLLNEKRIQVVAEVEEKYEAANKELEIISLSSKNIKAENKLKLFRYLIFGLCVGLLGFVSFIYFIRQNHKKNVIIQNNNLKIASDKIEILEQSKEITKLSSLIKGQEYERERIAKELHDGLGGLLAISHSKLSNLTAKNEMNKTNIEESKNLVGEAYDQVRQISHNLMPLDLEKFGLVPTLKNMISMVNNQNNDINIDFRTYNFDLALNNELGLNIYRIVQEAITNILKYAKAKNVLIELIQHEQHVSLSIEDDGVGLDLMNFKSGIGIQNMRNRSELFSGSFDLDSTLGVGTSISVQIPVPASNIA